MTEFQTVQYVWNVSWLFFLVCVVVITGPSTVRELVEMYRQWKRGR